VAGARLLGGQPPAEASVASLPALMVIPAELEPRRFELLTPIDQIDYGSSPATGFSAQARAKSATASHPASPQV
jgi:hypothetical protein